MTGLQNIDHCDLHHFEVKGCIPLQDVEHKQIPTWNENFKVLAQTCGAEKLAYNGWLDVSQFCFMFKLQKLKKSKTSRNIWK